MKRLIFCFLASPCFAADVKPTFTMDQAQIIVNMANSEMERACQKGNCVSAESMIPIIKEIVRAAQTPSSPTGEVK